MTAGSIFVTGTDTGVGKTLVSAALLHLLAGRRLKVVGMKPIASGCRLTAEGMRNDDALALMAQSNVQAPYELVNPCCFAPAIAPHIAAAEAKVRIEMQTLRQAHAQLAARADVVVVEGAGGWLTPLNERQTLADFAAAIQAQVILVVGLRLGCLNHALLTAKAIEGAGMAIGGWVANTVDPQMQRMAENVQTLEQRLGAPLLGIVPHAADASPRDRAVHLKFPSGTP